jgi:hypothetical protein
MVRRGVLVLLMIKPIQILHRYRRMMGGRGSTRRELCLDV